MSRSDAQIGEAILKKRVEQLTGSRPRRVETRPGTKFRYAPPKWLAFQTPELRDILERVRETGFEVKANLKVDLPGWLKDRKVTVGRTEYAMGIGGLHSTEAGRSLHTDDERVLVDADVATQYPAIILIARPRPEVAGRRTS